MYFIDKSKKPKQLELYLTKPNKNRTTVGKLKHIDSRKLTVNFGKINELSFNLPYDIVINKRKARNPNIDQLREKFFIKAKFGTHTEWFVITKISKSSNDNDSLTVQSYSLGYQLAKDRMIDYEVSSYNAFQAFTDCLKGTGWKIGYINPELNLKHRQYNVSSKTKLDFIYEVAETLEGIPQFDTAKKEVNLYKEEEISQYKGFWITYGKYLNTITEDIDSDEVVTRLVVKGSNDLTINSVNPTGQSYIDDFSYFLYPFELDKDGKVIRSSDWMEDELALALVKYNSYVSSRKGEFNTLLETKKINHTELTKEQNILTELNTDIQIILDSIQVTKANSAPVSELNKLRDDKQKEINNQKEKIEVIQSKIKTVDNHILVLKGNLKIESHLNKDLLEELSNFIHLEEWSDDNQIDANDLYEAGIKQLETKNSPPINIKMGIVNFFEVVEEQHNWDRLSIGDIIKIKHDKLNIWIKSRIDQLVFDFDNVNIDVTISNSKRVESLAGKINRAVYTIDKVNTDYNSRKQNWMQMAQNFNLRNDRISDIPTSPTFRDGSIKHVQNDDGSINLTVSWDYPDFNSTKKNADNIDGFWIYLYSDTDSEPYYFGSKMANESAITVDSSKRAYTFPSFPANRFYTIGVRAYRSVDDDISLDGVLFSEIITPTNQPYLPSTDVNIKGNLNGVKHTVNNEPPENPNLNDVWINPTDAKTRVWNGTDWKVNNDLNDSIEHTDKVADRITGEFENKLRDEIGLVLEDVDKAMEEVEKEVKRIETEVVPEVERVINETYIPQQPLPPDSTGSGLWWDTSFDPPIMKRKDEVTGEWIALAPDANEIDEIIENMKNDITLDYKEYTDQEIQDTKTNILNELNGQIVNVKDDISSLNNRANDLLQRVSDSELELQSAGGKITKVEQNIDTINGSLLTTINQLSNLDGVVTGQQASISLIAGELEAKATKTSVDTLTGRVSTAEGSISTIAGKVTLKANAEDVYTKTQINTELGKKVDLTVYNNKMSSLDVSINGIAGRVTNTETNINNLTGEVTSAKSQIASLDIKANGISTKVNEVRADLEGLKISDRNLLRNSGESITNTGYPTKIYTMTEKMVVGETYTVRLKGTLGNGKTHFGVWLDGGNISLGTLKNNGDGTYSLTFIGKAGNLNVSQLHVYPVPNTTVVNSTIEWIKLIKGDKTSKDWSPAPEDIVSRITLAETKIDQTAHDLTFKASQTSVDGLTGRMSSAESSLNVQAGQIASRVEKNGVISSINQSPESIKLQAGKVDIAGLVSFINNDNTPGTVINGSRLLTGSITASKLNSNEIFANTAVVDKIRTGIVLTSELNASSITTGMLDAGKVSVQNLSASSIIGGTLDANIVTVTGQINIVRPDGAVAALNGVLQGDFMIDRATPFYMDEQVSVSSNFFMTRSFSSVIADALYFKHAGRYLTFVVWARTLQAGCRVDLVNMDSGESVKVNATLGFPYNSQVDSTFQTITIDLGRPTFRTIGIYLKFNSYAQGVPTYMRYTIKTISG